MDFLAEIIGDANYEGIEIKHRYDAVTKFHSVFTIKYDDYVLGMNYRINGTNLYLETVAMNPEWKGKRKFKSNFLALLKVIHDKQQYRDNIELKSITMCVKKNNNVMLTSLLKLGFVISDMADGYIYMSLSDSTFHTDDSIAYILVDEEFKESYKEEQNDK